MAIEVITKDCSSLSDAEFAEMSELGAPGGCFEIGLLSKEADNWVLNSQARRDGELQGFVYSTLERVGGTPALLLGLGKIADNDSAVLKAILHEQFHKARMAFPDEDVVVSVRLSAAGPLEALGSLSGLRPWPDTRVNGEERAWGRRLSARFKCVEFDDRTMLAEVEGTPLVLDYGSQMDADIFDGAGSQVEGLFAGCVSEMHVVVVWGWAMAEFLDDFTEPAS